MCGIAPILFIVLFVASSYRRGIVEKTDAMVKNEMQHMVSLASNYLNHASDVLTAVSEDPLYEEAWRDYQEGKSDRAVFYEKIENRMADLFQLENWYGAFAFCEKDSEGLVCRGVKCERFNNFCVNKKDRKYKRIQEKDVHKSEVIATENQIYIVQKLYTSSEGEWFGTLVLELNTDKMFKEMKSKVAGDMAIYINDSKSRILIEENAKEEWNQEIEKKLLRKAEENPRKDQLSIRTLKYSGYIKMQFQEGYHLSVLCFAPNKELYLEVYEFYKVIIVVILAMISMFIYAFYFFEIHISKPITKMIDTAKEIEQGAIGTTVCGEKMPNKEFEYLREAFDKMSKQIKYLFDYAYDEKMARKDAKIMALQAQINPHFLNNTLEMMNWQARMSGDLEVSSMIESLGIVLDYNMNREAKRLTTLAKELRCADAYFYIISKRFGKRLVVEKEIQKELLSLKVPQLVLQPMIENAVTHGIERTKEGIIRIKIYRDEEKLYLKVMNTGEPLTEEEKEKIESLLKKKPEEIGKGAKDHMSLAIRNINERVKLIYGEEYGLTIEQEGIYIVATITIPAQIQDEVLTRESRENERKHLKETGCF